MDHGAISPSQMVLSSQSTCPLQVEEEGSTALAKKMQLQRKRAVAEEVMENMGGIAERIDALSSSDEYYGTLVNMMKDYLEGEMWKTAGWLGRQRLQ